MPANSLSGRPARHYHRNRNQLQLARLPESVSRSLPTRTRAPILLQPRSSLLNHSIRKMLRLGSARKIFRMRLTTRPTKLGTFPWTNSKMPRTESNEIFLICSSKNFLHLLHDCCCIEQPRTFLVLPEDAPTKNAKTCSPPVSLSNSSPRSNLSSAPASLVQFST